jgi:hypothetical protein
MRSVKVACAVTAVILVLFYQPAKAEKRTDSTLGFSINFDANSVMSVPAMDAAGDVYSARFKAATGDFEEDLWIFNTPVRYAQTEQEFIQSIIDSDDFLDVHKDEVTSNGGYQARFFYANRKSDTGIGGCFAEQTVVIPEGEGFRVYEAQYLQIGGARNNRAYDQLVQQASDFVHTLQVMPRPAVTTTPPAPQMQLFTSAEGRFSILFPGTPQQSTKPADENGSAVYTFSVTTNYDSYEYTVRYSDSLFPQPKDAKEVQDDLITFRDAEVEGMTLPNDTPIELNGVPGRSLTAVGGAGKYSFNMRIYLAPALNRLYQVYVRYYNGNPAPGADQFLNSFQIH